jgi:ATP-dependent helicase/DNAse subunit B
LTPAALERYLAHPTSLLLAPTATMAEHLRHQLARAGHAVRPKSIQTFAAFLDEQAPMRAAPAALTHWLLERALARQQPVRFRAVAEFPGFLRQLAGLFDLAPAERFPADVAGLFQDVKNELDRRGYAPRHARLAAAAQRLQREPLGVPVVLDGFFKLATAETALVEALARSGEVTLTLPEWPGAEPTLKRLRAAGWRQQRVAETPRAPVTVVRAPNMEREVAEVARRILEAAARGLEFRQMAVVVRSRDPYGPLVESTLARFGIPFRSYFTETLDTHPAIQFRAGLVRAALAGWDHEVLLRALRLPASGWGGTEAGDALDFELRRGLPRSGWPHTAGLEAQSRQAPADWAARLRALRDWAPPLVVEDGAGWERVRAWRSTALAERGWEAAVDFAAEVLGDSGPVRLGEFWKHVERVLALEPLRVPDQRRNVVHLLDAYEVRQWSLPLVFVVGMTERHFPQYHREDPIVGDAVLRRAGLDTAEDREREERFLFTLAITRASEQTILSYPQYDERGQETLPSFFLPEQAPELASVAVRPAPRAMPEPAIPHLDVTAWLAGRHAALSASAVESYLQCPFQFFVKKTLGLIERPKAPRDRLDVRTQGDIMHAALAAWVERPETGARAFDEAFEKFCRDCQISASYRVEAVRLEMLRSFEQFTRDRSVVLREWTRRLEEPFDFTLSAGLRLRGTLDRLEIGPDGEALVIDYKYSAKDKLGKRLAAAESGEAVQAGVYLLAAHHHLRLRVAGFLFCHVKKEVAWGGWHRIPDLAAVGERRTAEGLAELAEQARQAVLQAHQEILGGRWEVRPADEQKCGWCEARDVCRVETLARVREAGA